MNYASSRHGWIKVALCLCTLPPPSAHAQEVLEQLIGAALASYPSTQAQRALVESAEAGVEGARWQFYPTPSVTMEQAATSATDRLYQGDNRVSTLRLQQPLWTGGRLRAGLDKAEAGLSASQASLEEVSLQLGLRVVQAYGDWFSAYLKTLANQKNLTTHVRLREQIKRRISEGLSAQSDLTLALERLESIVAEVAAGLAQGDIGLVRLRQLVGRPVDGGVLAAGLAAPRDLGGGAQGLLDQALAINPAVQKAQAQAKVQEAVIEERRADYSPEVYARIERQYGNYNFPNSAPENRLFIGLSTRFGPGLSLGASIEAARTQLQAALAEVEVQSRTVGEQVLSDHMLAVSMVRRIAAIEASLRAAADVSESYDRQFLAGRKSWLDVMNAARELAQTETQLADLRSTQLVVSWRLAIYTRGVAAVTQKIP